MSYQHLTQDQRYQIERLPKEPQGQVLLCDIDADVAQSEGRF